MTLRTADDADPGFERAAFDRRKDSLVRQGRASVALPRDGIVLQDRGEQIEFLVK